MAKVLVTGGAGTIGTAVVRRLIRDPAWEVRVSDQRTPPAWMAEACEIHTGDLRDYDQAREAARGCTHVIHLAAIVGGIGNFHKLPHTLLEVNNGLYNSVFRAALEQHGLPYTICRPFNAYGPGEMPEDEPGIAHAVPDLINKVLSGQKPLQIFGSGEQTRTLTHIDDIAEGIVTATGHPAAENEDFNVSWHEEMTVAEIAEIVWEACGMAPEEFELEHLPTFKVDVQRRWPSTEKAKRLLGFEARIDVREGVRQTADWLRENGPVAHRA
jgi:nucleoside-diphosphate-sugar epimerase